MSSHFYGVRIAEEAKKRTLKNMLPKSPTDAIKVGQDYRFLGERQILKQEHPDLEQP